MQTFVIRAFAADVLNTKFFAFNTPNIKNTFTSNASNAKKKKKKKKKNHQKIIFYSIDYLSSLSCLFLLSHSLSSFFLSSLQITSLKAPFKSIVVLHNQDLKVSTTLFTKSTLVVEIGVVDIEINCWSSRLAHGFCNCNCE